MRKNQFAITIEKFFGSIYFMILTAIIVLLSSFFSLELFAFAYFTLALLLICIFSKSSRPVLVLLLMVVFTMSKEHFPPRSNTSASSDFLVRKSTLITIFSLAVICLASFIYYIIKTKSYKAMFTKKTRLTFGLIAYTACLTFNGITQGFSLPGMLFGCLQGLVLLVIYVFFIHTLDTEADVYKYFCNICACILVVVFIQLFEIVLRVVGGGYELDKYYIILGWGISNNIGAVCALLIPPVMYMASKSKWGWVYLIIAVLGVFGVLASNSRASMVFAYPIFLVLLIICLIKSKNKLGNFITTGVVLVCGVIALIVFRQSLMLMIKSTINSGFSDSGRFKLYKTGLEKFLSSPIFGVGFLTPIRPEQANVSIFSNMFHNTFIQIIASAGIAGLIGFIWMRVESVLLFVRKITLERVFMLCGILMVYLISLLDNHVFYFYPMFFCIVQLVLAERDLNNKLSSCDNFKEQKEST